MPRESRPEFARQYAGVRALASTPALPLDAERRERARWLVDALWDAFGGDGAGRGISWIGVYALDESGDQMTLLERRDKPACSPISMAGACGRACRERRALVVDDVAALGEGYIACDPRDRSELVIPLFERDGRCWGVLDADSYHEAAFSERDAAEMTELCETLGLSSPEADRDSTAHA